MRFDESTFDPMDALVLLVLEFLFDEQELDFVEIGQSFRIVELLLCESLNCCLWLK